MGTHSGDRVILGSNHFGLVNTCPELVISFRGAGSYSYSSRFLTNNVLGFVTGTNVSKIADVWLQIHGIRTKARVTFMPYGIISRSISFAITMFGYALVILSSLQLTSKQ